MVSNGGLWSEVCIAPISVRYYEHMAVVYTSLAVEAAIMLAAMMMMKIMKMMVMVVTMTLAVRIGTTISIQMSSILFARVSGVMLR